MKIENHEQRDHYITNSGCFFLLIIAVIDFVISGIIAMVIFMKYLSSQGFNDSVEIALLLKIDIWVPLWLGVFLALYLMTGGGFWYTFYWKHRKA